ncbi:hypothetical protein M413DRAFT_438583 [Hebeloma cylindrosporum]|uniref:RlpA-like protein double-psi beta-barrel domain-containing protein n=1 Tax=Hebeloma cylindrosporum TaxID=76867 RepID=A0A0C2Z8C8_HEBCY|nr:hypothetical protein M413DRAFT_438583 [Hebeloma cylindrosporum h7]
MFANLLNLSVLALALPITTLASSFHGNPIVNRHHDIARRAEGNVEVFKRISGARWSYYDVETGNAGSCGQFHKNSDFTVAMNVAQMNKGTMCFKTIRMTYNGKTTTASVTDTCPGCPYGGLDLTEGLFSFFAPHSVGIIYGEWEFTDGNNNPPPPPAPPKPTTTWRPTPIWTPPPPPTTTRRPTTSSTPTPTPTPTPTTSSTRQSSSSSRSSSRASSSASSSASVDYSSAGLAVPTGTIDRNPGQPENLADLTQAFVQLGGIALAGANI